MAALAAEVAICLASEFFPQPTKLGFRDLGNSSISLIDRLIRIRISSGVLVSDGDPPERLARHLARSLSTLQPE